MFKMNKKGFTLVELLVVLAILGLLAGIGIPQYMATLRRSRQAADAALVATVQSAVDGYMAETGLNADVTPTGTGTDYLALRDAEALKSAAKGVSILTGEDITLASFLEGGLPTTFKSMKVESEDWYITSNGKVYVRVGIGADAKTIPSPAPTGAIIPTT